MNKSVSGTIVSMRVTVIVVFLLMTTVTALVALGLQYYSGQRLANSSASKQYTIVSDGIADKWRHIGELNNNVIELLANNPTLAQREQRDQQLAVASTIMLRNPLYYGIYIGQSDGSFLELINLDTSEIARKFYKATPTDKWLGVVIDSVNAPGQRRLRYMDKNFQIRVERTEDTDYNPATRPWYIEATTEDRTYVSDAYLFAQLGVPGRTISRRIKGTDAVIAIDMTLATVSEFLREQDISNEGELYIYRGDGQVIASSLQQDSSERLPIPSFPMSLEERDYIASLPELKVSNELDWPPFDYALLGAPRGYSIDVIRMIAAMTGLKLKFVNGLSWAELVDEFKAGELDLLHSLVLTGDNEAWGAATDGYMQLPFGIVTLDGQSALNSLEQLAGQTLAIPAGWSIIPIIRERFPTIEIVESVSTLNAMEMVLDGSVAAALDNEVILRYVQEHYYLTGLEYHIKPYLGDGPIPDTLHVMASDELKPLVPIVNRAIKSLAEPQRAYLHKTWLNYEKDEENDSSGTVPSDILIDAAQDPVLHGTLISTLYKGTTYRAYSAPLRNDGKDTLYLGILIPEQAVIGESMQEVKMASALTAGFLLLLLPLSWAFANPIVRPVKQLAIENEKVQRREYDSVARVPSHIKELDELSDSMVSMVSAIQAHEIAQRELMDSFIRLIAQAIDDKSAYTGGHCERVPELALMLAEKASQSSDGPFGEFRLSSDEQWREYRIAAWLHDCGKITTPEHIVDKGSKLETIYNRVHEVRMRFEALWRDAEIEYWKGLHKGPDQENALKSLWEDRKTELQDNFAFVAECNVGGEFLDQDKQERLLAIAKTTWQRNFDDRLGLSPVEELQVTEGEPQALPATEYLLQDKPQHIIARTTPTQYPPEYGINMDIPEHLYNLGEVYNLSISRGTLTAEDRFKINEHMISTIKMLESLPFPEELKNVPRYASTHHETMRGSGYPRKLPGAQLSTPERILAVADVFEALTASDRPYKKAKPISVAIDILHKMVEDEHLDRDCFELFVSEGVYLDYAQRFLDPSQIDQVDTGKYISAS
ncbi:MAG: HD domain-containing phosphohydrolase [Halioglobus sp.]